MTNERIDSSTRGNTLRDDAPLEGAGKQVLARVARLHDLYVQGEIPGPEKHEVHPELSRDSRENYLYFTLACCLNFQRNSPALWRSALQTYEDPETNYVFYPERTAREDRNALARDLLKHRLALQTNKHPMIWFEISRTLATHYENDPRNILAEGDYDVVRILAILRLEKRELFPYLGGPKLSNYWLFILSRFSDAKLDNLDAISIIPDTHVLQSTVKLGLLREPARPPEVEDVWRGVLRKLGISPGDMHSALWRWSRNNFKPALE